MALMAHAAPNTVIVYVLDRGATAATITGNVVQARLFVVQMSASPAIALGPLCQQPYHLGWDWWETLLMVPAERRTAFLVARAMGTVAIRTISADLCPRIADQDGMLFLFSSSRMKYRVEANTFIQPTAMGKLQQHYCPLKH